MRLTLILLSMVLVNLSQAQKTVDVTNGETRVGQGSFFTVSGTPFLNEKYVKLIDGSPYFKDEWIKGVLVSETGQEYKSIPIKLDLFGNQIHYQDEKGVELLLNTAIKEVVLTDALSTNYRFFNSKFLPKPVSPVKEGWYQWLGGKDAVLYKYYNKNMFESKPYNSATYEQTIKTTDRYFVVYNNAWLELKKIKDAPSVLANKKDEIETFLKEKDNKNAPLDDRYAALIEYYNTLLQVKK